VPTGESEGGRLAVAGEAGTLTARLQSRTTIRVDAPTIDDLQRELAELRLSSARVLTAADEQRRSIERELHDGAMQELVALGVKLQLAGRLVETDSPAATELLDEMLHDVHEALDDVRLLAWRVYPSLLLDRGLGEALSAAASLVGLPTRVEAADIGRLTPELEASIYFCCVELLQRAAEDGGHATIRLRRERDLARFDVTLEPADLQQWKLRDLSSVADRLRAFGGGLVVEAGQDVRIACVLQGVVAEPCSSAR
jgi:signal transduction histidine kinase